MGYTHYWKGTVPPASTSLLAAIDYIKTKVTMQPSGIALRDWNGSGDPVFTDTEISFNGDEDTEAGDLSYETFAVTFGSSVVFNCCKTAKKPYDIAVVAILEALNLFSDNEFTWSSDGEPEETLAGRTLAHDAIKSIA